jgi:hypothetical protein
MKQLTMRKVLEHIGTVLGIVGALVAFGSILVWTIGPELLWRQYEGTKPVLPFFLAGVGLVVLGVLLSPTLRKTGAEAPDPERLAKGTVGFFGKNGPIHCGKCGAPNDGRAKFCNQCGTAI